MSGRFVSIGIDHGTTHSCIATMDGDRPRIIKSFTGEDLMPSAVYIDRRGRRFIGRPAIEAMHGSLPEEGNGHTGYKLRIGQCDLYEFSAARKVMTAPELGGIVIRELLLAYEEEAGERPLAAVVTVPAKFEHSACEGTRMAARLAGLSYAPLISEPVAAALAYGCTAVDESLHWIVFDLGEGTLDVSLVMARKGLLFVSEEGHAGDNRLGGRKFDRELMSYVVDELARHYALSGFSEKNPDYGRACGRLLLACQEARMRLWRKEETVIEIDGALCHDERGTAVKVEVPVTRAQYEKLIAADIERMVHHCQTLLARSRLTPKDVNRLILVGGATKEPYLRQVLAERLRIGIDSSLDPVTAVALGAALYAGTIEIPKGIASRTIVADPGTSSIELKLEYERKSKIATPCVVGRVEGPGMGTGGLTYEIRRNDGLWSSMLQPIDESGCFSVEVLLIEHAEPRISRFTTVVRDHLGCIVASVDEPAIWYPFPEAKPRLANSLLLGVRGNVTIELIKQGTELPARGKTGVVTTTLIRKGSSEDSLRLPVLEAVTHFLGGEDPNADCNMHVGTLTIVGSDKRVTRDLPVGTEIEIAVSMDESREIRAVAFVPLLDEEFEAVFRSGGFVVDIESIAKRFEDLRCRFGKSRVFQSRFPRQDAEKALEIIERLEVIEGIERDLGGMKHGESDAGHRACRRVLELAGTLNAIDRMQMEVRFEKMETLRRDIRHLRPFVYDEKILRLVALERELLTLDPEDYSGLREIEKGIGQLTTELRGRSLQED